MIEDIKTTPLCFREWLLASLNKLFIYFYIIVRMPLLIPVKFITNDTKS